MSRYRCPAGRFHKWVFVQWVTDGSLYRCRKCGNERIEEAAS